MSAKWSEGTLTKVRLIYGMGVGTFLIVAGVWFIPNILEDQVVTREELILVGVICIGGGLMAALPTVAFQAIGKAVELWQARKNGGTS